jgi:hypothetical protein
MRNQVRGTDCCCRYRYYAGAAAGSNTNNNKRPFTLLFSHGNAEDLFLNDPRMRMLCAATRCDVLAYDFVGYSTSFFEGHCPSEKGCLRAIEAACVRASRSLCVFVHACVRTCVRALVGFATCVC